MIYIGEVSVAVGTAIIDASVGTFLAVIGLAAIIEGLVRVGNEKGVFK
jgi:hypothetical protein